jgi:hypothetical protein
MFSAVGDLALERKMQSESSSWVEDAAVIL